MSQTFGCIFSDAGYTVDWKRLQFQTAEGSLKLVVESQS